MTYLESNLLAQSYYAKVIKFEDGRFKDLYKNLISNYDKILEEGKDVNNIDYKIKTLKEQIQAIMKEKDLGAYTASDFIGKMAKLDYLEKQKIIQDKKRKEEDCVKETFGGLNLDDIRKPKTQQELIDERNERLAILYNLKSNGKIDQEEYIKNIVAVRRVYERSIKTALVEDLKKVDINNKQHLRKFKNLLQRIKNVFKIGKPTADIENEIGKSSLIKELAVKALSDAGDNLISKDSEIQTNEGFECLTDAVAIKNTIADVKLSDKTEEIVSDFFNEKIITAVKTAHQELTYDGKEVLHTAEENKEMSSNKLLNERFSFTTITHNNGRIKNLDYIKVKQNEMENYFIKNFKHINKTTGNLKEGINVEHVFEDAEVNKAYKEIQSMFKVQKESLGRNERAEKELDVKTQEVQNIRKQNNQHNV